MKAIMRAIAALLLITLSASAVANPLVPSDIVCEDARKALIEQEFYKHFDKYVAYKTGKSCLGDFCKLLYTRELSKLKKIVFKNPGSAEYQEALRFIDSQHALDPQLISDLAQELQLYWEAHYGIGLARARASTIRASTETGAIVGFVLSVALAGLARKPSLVGRYNRLFRLLYPLAGAVAGTSIAEAGAANAITEQGLPPAPAHLITLGVSDADVSYSPDALTKEALELTASLTMGTVVAETLVPRLILAFRAGNAAATPAKLNPYVLLISLAGTLVLEKGLADAYDRYQFDKLKGELVDLATELAEASASDEKAIALSRAEALAIKAKTVAAYLNRPLLEEVDTATQDELDARAKHSSDPQALASELKRIQDALGARIAAREESEGLVQDREYLAVQVLERLALRGSVQGASGLDAVSQAMARAILDGFEPWLDRGERRAWMSLGPGRREALFSDYVAGLLRAKRSRLARELLDGHVPKNSSRILLEAEMLIREQSDELLNGQADVLRAALLEQITLFPTAWSAP